MATKLHELLAVDTNLDTQSTKVRTELMGTFAGKRHLFAEKRITFQSNEEGAQAVTEEQSDIQTTVAKEIEWISEKLASHIDVGHQIDIANTVAKADVITEDDETILKDVPATSLLQLEKRLQEVLALAHTIPTLDPAKGFKKDEAKGAGIFAAREVTKQRTKKLQKPLVLYPATDKHPAQTQLITEDVSVGTIREQEWSSMITPADKADVISNVEKLLRAVKKARARANQVEVDTVGNKIGKKLLDYIFQPLKA